MSEQQIDRLDSAVIYAGPSRLGARTGKGHARTGQPIVAIVTGLYGRSENPKTGPMAQLWILRADVAPSVAVVARTDDVICGDCGLRGTGFKDRGCYVGVVNAPGSVYRKYTRGAYAVRNPGEVNAVLHARGIPVRLGAYGDPCALPVWVLRDLTVGVSHTGYTHAWRQPWTRAYQGLIMASADSPADVRAAHADGWRTFRTRAPEQEILSGEISCPASDEAGHRTTCADCTLCDGNRGAGDRRKSIVILAHGATTGQALTFIRSRAQLERAQHERSRVAA